MKVALTQFETHIVVLVTGKYDLDLAVGRFPHLCSTCRSTGITKAVIDFRKLVRVPEETQKMIYAFGIEEHYKRHLENGGAPLQIAYLGAPSANGKNEAGVGIAKQSDLPFRLFTVPDDAYKWLKISPPGK